MDKNSRKIDAYVLGLMLELFIIVIIFMIHISGSRNILDFIMLCITFFTVIVTYTGGLIVGLILSSIAIFAYGSYIFYNNLIQNVDIDTISYIWMISIPIVTFTAGKLQSYIVKLQETNMNLRESYKDLVTIDEQTGLGNIKLFYMHLDREISKSRRHKTPCTLMLIKFPYYKEIKKIVGENRTNKLIKEISDVIIKSTRSEDERYTIENDTLAIIMPTTDITGAQVVKDRIKSGIDNLNLKLNEEKKYVNIDTKIAILQYKEEINTSMEFKSLTEEELQYDV
ncbi:GGDEF domain-containing protein [Romboutsia lituseburensis]|uniref:Diguanylate cyclase (GGDEF) domain-containing protein n=1 Tax=Romboutsia lituseburensis DSM 797 TaxID=1121325 RepID=A0A1G9HZB8_9FIRM|nr:GGDEF domain-containing protein [Romboutsia lituseburensis]CEH34111.1 GGDEF domain protein [Romboutsia lituseburensis]SDL18311.1 diguanylate cyclase (GGDEF) domain-containing protein [Romboutsia lituseburensis DSM 797]